MSSPTFHLFTPAKEGRFRSLLVAALVVIALALPQTVLAQAGCQLSTPGSPIQHVIYIQFDNLHLTRDNPNVPSDLEQIPHLLNFIKGNGVMLSNHHTPLISHTANDILTALTGVYSDRHGQPVANSYRYFNPNGTTNPGVSFAYWTAPVFDPSTTTPTDTKPTMIGADGKVTPAPWVAFTRAGCDVGNVSTANAILENTAIDIPTVFGPGSPEAAEVLSNPAQAFADFVGIGVHCAAGSPLCSAANHGRPDLLPDEPGGYNGFNALFGHVTVAPQLSSSPLKDLNGNVIQDSTGHIGFPGFDGMSASVSLAYTAAMQEKGIPVTFSYISDAHDKHTAPTRAYGPGEAGYVAALADYDAAFAKFFDRLKAAGIDQSNTLFIVTADENDHFVGGTPSPSGCDGVTNACTYSQIGELNGNLKGLLVTQTGNTTAFTVHSDSAPTIYITGNPARDAAVTRNFGRAISGLTAPNTMTGTTVPLTVAIADPVEMKLLHMITADPARTPTLTYFANPDYFLFTGAPNCNSPCVTQQPGFAWNHGDVTPDIIVTWLGMAGPGVNADGEDSTTWSDHTDIRPTILSLTGLQDDYVSDGRALVEHINNSALPPGVQKSGDNFVKLSRVYKQLNAPVGQLGLDTLALSTKAIASNAPGDTTYAQIESQIASWSTQRDAIASQIRDQLNQAEFGGKKIDEQLSHQLLRQAQQLLDEVHAAAN